MDIVQSSYTVVDTSDSSVLSIYLNTIIMGIGLLSYICFRVVLIVKAKSVSNLLRKIYQYRSGLKDEDTWKSSWRLLEFIGLLCLALILVESILFGLTVTGENQMHRINRSLDSSESSDSWFEFLGSFIPLPYFLLMFTTATVRSIVFLMISTISFNAVMIYEDFCSIVEERLDGSKIIESPAKALSSDMPKIPQFHFPVSSMHLSSPIQFGTIKKWNNLRFDISSNKKNEHDLMGRYEEIEKLLHEATKVLSPLTLILIVVTVLVLVSDSYVVIVGSNSKNPKHFAIGCIAITEHLIYTGLVFIGQKVEDVVSKKILIALVVTIINKI
jgi:hypothetical protein